MVYLYVYVVRNVSEKKKNYKWSEMRIIYVSLPFAHTIALIYICLMSQTFMIYD